MSLLTDFLGGDASGLLMPVSKQTFTASGNFTAPYTGHYLVSVTGGGGGGGSNFGSGGAGSSTDYALVHLTKDDVVSVTVGAKGTGATDYSLNNATAGGVSSFGAHLSVAGGSRGITSYNTGYNTITAPTGRGCHGGKGNTATDLNGEDFSTFVDLDFLLSGVNMKVQKGGLGNTAANYGGGGGASLFGDGGAAVASGSAVAVPATSYGAGGGAGGGNVGSNGGAGADGIVIVGLLK